MNLKKLAFALIAAGVSTGAHATNGMNMDGYGPISSAMGGTSMAYDNGNAAMMNNPATLSLGQDGNRLDLAVGFLGPDVAATTNMGMGPMKAGSGGDAYLMPAVGWTRKDGSWAYGLGMFAQGGMGTEYSANTWIGMMDGMEQRSELGVGRVIAPLSYNVNDKLSVGGSLDFVWANLDIKMAMPGAVMAGLITGMPTLPLPPAIAGMARLDFSDDNDYTGKAKGTGWAGKLGFVYKASPTVSIGASYHSKTALSDMKTGASGATFFADVNGDGTYDPMIGEAMPGKVTVRDFEWPETFAFGVAIQATPETMLALDIKHIGWEDVMKNFNMTYSNAFGSVDFALPQNWDDQTVLQIGVSHKTSDRLTLRAGASFASNPIPDQTVHYLFPAITENHVSVGVGYALNKDSEINFSLTHAPEVSVTNPGMAPMIPAVDIDHAQTNWQLMYTRRF